MKKVKGNLIVEQGYAILFNGEIPLKDAQNNIVKTNITGYYAKKQPSYKWVFVQKIRDAKIWKNKVYAQNLLNAQKLGMYKKLDSKIVEVDIETEIKIKKIH